MKLIKFEAKGFKSFAEKITINFDGSIVGVVGPNGSGKSNINDAIKWVLGEQSSKSLRGDSMEDVIFSGSKSMKGMNYAEVILTFDNSDQLIDIPSKKIVVSRAIERGKGSKYYINGEIAKLKDIKAITMETGIAKSSLAIISQGTIASIAQSTPEERRLIFEEVAGISKYKKRKIESLKKLESTSKAIDKMKTIIYELQKQLGPLSRQAEKAKIYLEKSAKLKNVEIGLIVHEVTFFREKLKQLESELLTFNAKREEYEDKLSDLEIKIDSKNSYKLNLENEIIDLQKGLDKIINNLLNLESLNTKESHARKLVISGEIRSSSKEQIKAMRSELVTLGGKISEYRKWSSKLEESIAEKRKSIDLYSKEHNEAITNQKHIQQKLYRANSRLEIMIDYKKNKSNLFQGTKTILNNKKYFSGIHDIVSNIIKVDIKYQKAIETILQNALQHIVVDNSETAVRAINFLKENKGGRSTFIPLSSIKEKYVNSEYLYAVESQEGFVDVAANLVITSQKFNVLKKFLLGNILVVNHIDTANNLSKLIDKKYMIVTLDGDIIRVGGVMSGGQRNNRNTTMNLDLQIEDLKNTIKIFDKNNNEGKLEISKLEYTLNEQQTLISELYIEQAKVKEKIDLTHDNFTTLKTTYEAKTNKKIDIDTSANSNEIENISDLNVKRSQFENQLKVKRNKIIDINNELSTLGIEKNEIEKLLRNLINNSTEQVSVRDKAEFYIQNYIDRLANGYDMTYDFALDKYKLKLDVGEAKERVNKLQTEIKGLGYINIDAVEQYDEIKERYDKLKENEGELDKAKALIISAIAEMDQIMIVKFDETINGVQEYLKPIFTHMFGGGEIKLAYIDPQNILETGVDVIAQPPGKSIRNLKLFSGGEKSLIAISLLFAILKYKPLPLCILDEVEAALDETNVIRYANLLQELRGKTQFMIITHRVGTMERIDQLYGVTMQQRGVTSLFSLKLKDAKSLIKDEDENK